MPDKVAKHPELPPAEAFAPDIDGAVTNRYYRKDRLRAGQPKHLGDVSTIRPGARAISDARSRQPLSATITWDTVFGMSRGRDPMEAPPRRGWGR